MNGTHSPLQRYGRPILFPILTRHFTQPAISLSLTQHTIMETDTVLATANKGHNGAYVNWIYGKQLLLAINNKLSQSE